jgi:hypothetical protein
MTYTINRSRAHICEKNPCKVVKVIRSSGLENSMNERDAVLNPGEWEALLFGVPDQFRHLVVKLAVAAGHMQPPTPAECPLCNAVSLDQQRAKKAG